jgi:hypothetical protein
MKEHIYCSHFCDHTQAILTRHTQAITTRMKALHLWQPQLSHNCKYGNHVQHRHQGRRPSSFKQHLFYDLITGNKGIVQLHVTAIMSNTGTKVAVHHCSNNIFSMVQSQAIKALYNCTFRRSCPTQAPRSPSIIVQTTSFLWSDHSH